MKIKNEDVDVATIDEAVHDGRFSDPFFSIPLAIFAENPLFGESRRCPVHDGRKIVPASLPPPQAPYCSYHYTPER